jgi:Fe-Mn family superoxide dismutase
MKTLENKVKILTENIKKIGAKRTLLSEAKKIGIEKLPYSYSALKNFIDSETMDFHYNKHYKGYVKKLNDALSKKEYGDVELEDIIKRISKYNKTIRNNAGGAFNHALFWKMLSPKEQECNGPILKKINTSFGSLKEFKTKFESVAKNRFGSGWVWLVLTKRNTLKIISTPNQDNPLMNVIKNGGYPLLGLDLWEHSYYLKYRNKRDEYIHNFWKCVNWEFVNELFKMKTQTKINENVKLKSLITESTSQRCNRADVLIFRDLFNTNKYVKNVYRYGIDKILKSVFSDYYYEKDAYGPNQMSGIYDFEQKGRSVLNKMNTNYEIFCILTKDVNLLLSKLNQPLINFKDKSVKEQIEDVKRLIDIVETYKKRIFSLSSSTFENIIAALGSTNALGDITEDYTVKKLKEIYGEKNVEKIGFLGSSDDALKGIDCQININNKIITAQIKPYGSFEIEDGKYTMIDTGQVKDYETDWLIFAKNYVDVYVFNNSETKIINGKFVIPENNLIQHIK